MASEEQSPEAERIMKRISQLYYKYVIQPMKAQANIQVVHATKLNV